MSDPFDKMRDAWGHSFRPGNFGDPQLADRVIKAAAEGELKDGVSLTTRECKEDLGIHVDHCIALRQVLTQFSIYTRIPIDRKLSITPKEKKHLEESGFNKTFVDALAGTDGKRALRERVKWLSDHVVTKWWRADLDLDKRLGLLFELERIGPDAQSAIPALLQLGGDSDPDVQRKSIEVLEAIESDEFSKFYYLGKMCTSEERGFAALIESVSASNKEEQRCAVMALGNMGEAAPRAVPALIELAKQSKDQPIEEEAFSALAGIGKSAAPAVPLIMRRYEELRAPLKKPEFRAHLINHLERIAEPSPDVLNFLEEILTKEYAWGFDRVGYEAINALRTLGRPALPVLLRGAQEGVSHSLVAPLGKTIEELKIERKDIRSLLAALEKYWPEDSKKQKSFDTHDRQPYLSAIWALGTEAMDELEEVLLQDEKEEIRVMAVRVLETFFNGPVRVAPLLVRLLEDRNPQIRKRLAVFFGEKGIAAKEALPLLVTMRLNRDEIESCRRAAAEAIAKIEKEVL